MGGGIGQYLVQNQNTAWSIAFMQDELLVRRLQQQIDFRLKGLQNYQGLEQILRNVRLVGDKRIKIYEYATIAPKKFAIDDLKPLSLYTLRGQLAQHKKMFWHLQRYDQNLFDLAGLMQYTQDGTIFTIAPPIVETFQEPTTGQRVTVIIDGLHRIYAARQIGFDEVWAIELQDIPSLLPPIALPITWEDIAVCSDVPPGDKKRIYRYDRPADYPDLTAVTTETITDENYRYFLYRDFSSLGSSGIRVSR